MSFPSDGPSSALTLSARSRGFLSDRQLHPKTARRVIRRKCPRLPEDIYSGWLRQNGKQQPSVSPAVTLKVSARKPKMTRKGGRADTFISVTQGQKNAKMQG